MTKWHELTFREHVRSLSGNVVVARIVMPGRGTSWIRGILEVPNGIKPKVRVGGLWIEKTRLIQVLLEYREIDWDCGCGCGGKIRLKYRPPHGPPFFFSGHRSRLARNGGNWKKGHPAWNKGLTGDQWRAQISPDAKKRIFDALRRGHATMSGKATGIAHAKNGAVFVRVPGRQPCGAAMMRTRARIVMEEAIGRPLRQDEIVWHRNGNRADDHPENLLVLSKRDKGALAKATVRGLTGVHLIAFVREKEELRALEPMERRRILRIRKRAPSIRMVNDSPLCPDCGMLRRSDGSCRCPPAIAAAPMQTEAR